ncbi:hypothetical protein SMICM17S_10060 [Streptomyces microflavus]
MKNVRARVDQVVDDPGRSEDRTALAAQRLGEGEAPICSSVRSARAVSRSREMPSGTDGGRKQPTATPAARQSAAHRTAASAEGAGRRRPPRRAGPRSALRR